jgi:type VI protein secretion system component VasA
MTSHSDQGYEELLTKLRSNSTEERQVAADQLSVDPDVDVLLRSMAYVLDSADELIDRGSSALRQAVGKHLFPSEFVPRGSMTILNLNSQVDKFTKIERGEEVLLQRPNKGTQRFRVLSETSVTPLNLQRTGSKYNAARDETTLTFALRSAQPFAASSLKTLPFLIQGDRHGAQIIYQSFRRSVSKIEVRLDGSPFFVDQSQLRNLFEGNEFASQLTRNQGALPFDLLEFFLTFPGVLRNFEIKLDQVHDQIEARGDSALFEEMESIEELDLVITFEGNLLEDIPLDPSYFLLNPIIVENMYEKRSLPVAYRGARSTLDFNINLAESNSEIPVDVLEVGTTLAGSTSEVVLTPDFSTKSADFEIIGRFQVVKKGPTTETLDKGTIRTSVSVDNNHLDKLTNPIQARLLCSNGSAVENLPAGQIFRGLNSDLGRFEMTSVAKTTRYQDVPLNEMDLLNGLLDAYACEINLFSDTARLKKLWRFYGERTGAAAGVLRRFELGIVEAQLNVTSVIYRLGNLPCYDIRVRLDDDEFDSPEEIFAYADILQMLATRLCPINCTSRFTVEKIKSAEVLKWPILIASERLSP